MSFNVKTVTLNVCCIGMIEIEFNSKLAITKSKILLQKDWKENKEANSEQIVRPLLEISCLGHIRICFNVCTDGWRVTDTQGPCWKKQHRPAPQHNICWSSVCRVAVLVLVLVYAGSSSRGVGAVSEVLVFMVLPEQLALAAFVGGYSAD